jgi:hypothetical protein
MDFDASALPLLPLRTAGEGLRIWHSSASESRPLGSAGLFVLCGAVRRTVVSLNPSPEDLSCSANYFWVC